MGCQLTGGSRSIETHKALSCTHARTHAHAGKEAAGTPHLLLGLLDCGNAAVKKALSKAGVELLELRVKVRTWVVVGLSLAVVFHGLLATGCRLCTLARV